LIALVLSLIIFFLLSLPDDRKTRKRQAAAGLTILLILVFFTAAFFGGIHRDTGRLVSGREVRLRMLFYGTALKIIKDHPWTGVGFENFRIVYPRYRTTGESAYMRDVTPTMVHNGYLQTAATNGLPSLAIYLLFLSSVFFLLLRAYRESKHQETDRLLLAAFFASLTGFLIQDLSGWPDISLTPFFWVLLGLAVSYSTGDEVSPDRPPKRKALIYGTSAILVLLLGLLVYGAVTRIYADHLLWKIGQWEMKDPERWPAATAALGRLLRAAGNDHHYLNAAGRIHTERFGLTENPAEYERAAGLFEKAHRENPFDPYVLIGRVDLETLALKKGLLEEASPYVESALEKMTGMDPNNPTVHAAAARLRLAGKHLGEALELVEKSRSLRPGDRRLILMEGEIHLGLGDYEKAVETYREAVSEFQRKNNNREGWLAAKYGLGFSLALSGKHTEALKEIDSVIKLFPREPYPFFIMGNIYRLMGETEKAEEALAEADRLGSVRKIQ
jgi:tetratricopeptide (TPR) repeat protein